MTESPSRLLLAVALDGAGWHPQAWRAAGARPADLFTPGYWVDLVRRAEAGGVDLVTIEDSLGIQSARWRTPDERDDQVRGRLDAVLVAARVAPATSRIGIVPVATTTHTEPFHVAKAVATLDWVSQGRAGVQVRVSGTAVEARQFGRRPPPRDQEPGPAAVGDLFDEASDFVEVLRRLWDSWEDGAEIRDAATGRFVDRDKLHYIDFEGRWFSVKGPSITPRPPQGQPLVAALAHVAPAYLLAARQADLVFVTPADAAGAVAIVADVRAAEAAAGRRAVGSGGGQPPGVPLRILADLVVLLDDTPGAAAAELARLDALEGRPYRSDAAVFAGTPAELADLLVAWREAEGGLSGFRLRPGRLPHDLDVIGRSLVPELRRRGVFPSTSEATSLRGRLGLDRPANRYATTGSPA